MIRAAGIIQPWWLDVPSVYGFFGILLFAYDRFLWNHWPFSRLPMFKIADLSGTWQLEIRTSHDEFAQSVTGRALIRQSASRMSISIETTQSTSHSLTASLLPLERLHDFELTYHYRNDPKPQAPPSMESHYGITALRFSGTPVRLQGEYFSGRGRQQHGVVALTRAGG